jgi:heptosyltransferase-2
MKILLAKRRALGDTVLLSSSVALLASCFPEAEISVLVPAAFAAVLIGNPHIRHLWSFEEGWASLLPKIRREKFDHFIHLHASDRARVFGWFTGAAEKHYHYQNSETEKAYGKHPNALEWDAFFFRSLFGDRVKMPAPMPCIYLSEEERAEGRRFWAPVDPSRVVFLGLGASRPTKRWLPEHFARLAELIKDRREYIPAIVVGPGEEEQSFAAKVIDQLRVRGMRPLGGGKGDFFHLAGLSVRDLAKALSAVRAYVGNDSGPKHIAAALGIPTVTLFGPEDPVEWHPYDQRMHPIFFQPGLSCRLEDNGRWCGIPVCDESSPEKHRCMRDLDPLDVLARVP